MTKNFSGLAFHLVGYTRFLILIFFILHGSCSRLGSFAENAPENQPPPFYPIKADAFSTKEILVMNKLPDDDFLKKCQQNMEDLSQKSTDQDQMIKARDLLTESVKLRPRDYHWCFYKLMSNLDDHMFQTESMEAKGKIFFDNMKSLWILSRALDRVNADKPYLAYLRIRYLQIQKDIFGRHLLVLEPPMEEAKKTEQQLPIEALPKSSEK